MELEIARVLPDQLQHLVGFNRGTYAKPELSSLNPDQITERFVQKIPFSEDDPRKAHFEGVDLGQYLTAGGAAKHGVFLLKLGKLKPDEKTPEENPQDETPDESADESSNEGEGEVDANDGADTNDDGTPIGDSRLIVLTDLGIIAKKSLDGSRDVFVQSISTGRRSPARRSTSSAATAKRCCRHDTDADGRARFADLTAFQREKQPAMLTSCARRRPASSCRSADSDRTLDYSRFDIGGERKRDRGRHAEGLPVLRPRPVPAGRHHPPRA